MYSAIYFVIGFGLSLLALREPVSLPSFESVNTSAQPEDGEPAGLRSHNALTRLVTLATINNVAINTTLDIFQALNETLPLAYICIPPAMLNFPNNLLPLSPDFLALDREMTGIVNLGSSMQASTTRLWDPTMAEQVHDPHDLVPELYQVHADLMTRVNASVTLVKNIKKEGLPAIQSNHARLLFATSYSFILKKLEALRQSVAHGKDIPVLQESQYYQLYSICGDLFSEAVLTLNRITKNVKEMAHRIDEMSYLLAEIEVYLNAFDPSRDEATAMGNIEVATTQLKDRVSLFSTIS